MAAPASKTIHDLTGDWTLNRKLSGDTDAILAFQGVGWMLRKTINYATITLHAKQYKDDAGTVHIDIEQTLTGGIPGTTELRTLNWTEAGHKDGVFGEVKGRSRMIKTSELGEETTDEEDRKWLSEGWEDGTDGDHVQSYAASVNNGWTANQIWGFQQIDGERRYCRNVAVRKNGKVIRDRLVYDYLEKTD